MQAAVIGVGSMGGNHARVYKELGVLSAVCDLNTPQAKAVGEKFGVPYFTSVDDLLAYSKFEAVSVVVPTQYHADTSIQCLEAGKHVLCEKPISDNLADAQKLVACSKAQNKVLAVGYIECFNPAFRALSTLIKDGVFGEITSINIKRVGGVGRSAGNVVLDLMTHDLSLLLNLFNSYPDKIYTHTRLEGDVVNSAQVLLSFGTVSAVCEANWISPVKIRQLHVTGTDAYCEVDMLKQTITQFDCNRVADGSISNFNDFIQQYALPNSQTMSVFQREPLKEELSLFLEAAEYGSGEIVTGETALLALKLTLEAAGG